MSPARECGGQAGQERFSKVAGFSDNPNALSKCPRNRKPCSGSRCAEGDLPPEFGRPVDRYLLDLSVLRQPASNQVIDSGCRDIGEAGGP